MYAQIGNCLQDTFGAALLLDFGCRSCPAVGGLARTVMEVNRDCSSTQDELSRNGNKQEWE